MNLPRMSSPSPISALAGFRRPDNRHSHRARGATPLDEHVRRHWARSTRLRVCLGASPGAASAGALDVGARPARRGDDAGTGRIDGPKMASRLERGRLPEPTRRGPQRGTYYRELWRAFSDPKLTIEDAGEEPPLEMSNTARREFERYFLLAYLAGIATPTGRGVDEYLEGLKQYRDLLVRDLLVENLATWGGCHVFGNVPREHWSDDKSVPFMPLEDVYVEPNGAIDHDGREQGEQKNPNEPLLPLIKRLVASTAPAKIVVVAADFGSGKSLSARMLAREWADVFLSSLSGSLELPLPIHVRCAEDFPSEKADLELTVRRAWKRQASSIGFLAADDDNAFAWPNPQQRMVCLLDGLDEVALGEQHLKTLFQRLSGKTTANHRFVIFSRPGALPAKKELGDDVVVVRVQPFDMDQIERWLECWHKLRPEYPTITLQELKQRNLAIVTQTPILLFMVAFTWTQHTTSAEPPSLAEIYEYFFYQVATGKAEADRERHGPITAASEKLLAALKNATILGEEAQPADAMLWLMGRVAWEAHMLDQRHPPVQLTRRHIDNLLQDGEIPLPPEAADTIRVGLILALQTDLHSANHTILFGHQSFREFLVGRHWATILQRLVRSNHSKILAVSVLGGRLLGDNDKSFHFLMELINTTSLQERSASPLSWSSREREALVRWAQEVFEDERQEFGQVARANNRVESSLRNDRRPELREAALAIGSMISGSNGLRAEDPLTLRSMLAWFWLHSISAKIVAPKASFHGAILYGINLGEADFRQANLSEANLAEAHLSYADLSMADLSRAILSWANLSPSNLTQANLSNARLVRTDLSGAILIGCNLEGTDLRAADLSGAALNRANLREADLSAANLSHTDFSEANLSRANLQQANLREACLQGADLNGAHLYQADLREADLRGSNLCGANLSGANLLGTRLKRDELDALNLPDAAFDEATLWPDGVDRATLPAMVLDSEAELRARK
jgi:uncharacterized protein YjbI with pentapeptide repeats